MNIDLINVMITVVDIRGYTSFAGKDIDTFMRGRKLCENLYLLVKSEFGHCFIKPALDGFMILKKIHLTLSQEGLEEYLIECLTKVKKIDMLFMNLAKDKKLGWGLTRGLIIPTSYGDYHGMKLTEAFRLCDCARPSGIILDYEDYKSIEKSISYQIKELNLKGFEKSIKVFVSQEVKNGLG